MSQYPVKITNIQVDIIFITAKSSIECLQMPKELEGLSIIICDIIGHIVGTAFFFLEKINVGDFFHNLLLLSYEEYSMCWLEVFVKSKVNV